jgi:hypothetical protein
MPRKLLLSAAMLTVLSGCGLGWPFGQHPDPNAAQAVQQSAPLVQDCQGRFKTWLGATPAKQDTGPTITRSGDVISIRLEAESSSPTAIDAIQFHCDYENGQLDSAGPVQ